jgi:hypothetical protein
LNSDQKNILDTLRLKVGNLITLGGWPLWTVPELSFEKKQLVPALQQMLQLSNDGLPSYKAKVKNPPVPL